MLSIEVDQDTFWQLARLASTLGVDTPNEVIQALLDEAITRGPEHHSASGAAAERLPRSQIFFSARSGPLVSGSAGRTGEGALASMPALQATDALIKRILRAEFTGSFRTVPPFRMMFEGDEAVVYFQNFNKQGSSNLWYRLSPSALSHLRRTRKRAFVCLTNPADGMVLLLPLADIEARAKARNWAREEMEINIDPADLRWRELDWSLLAYRRAAVAGEGAA